MQAIGIDLAWGEVNESGLVAIAPDGSVQAAGWARGLDETLAWVEAHAESDAMLLIDAPLVVANGSGQRMCEREVGQRYGAAWVSANSTNRSSTRRAGEHLRAALEATGWTYSDGTEGPPAAGRVISECYPYTTLVGAEELDYSRRPAYKRRPRGVSGAEWPTARAGACDELIRRLGSLPGARPPLDLTSNPCTRKLLEEPSPLSDRAYKHREDLVDACVAAWTAAMWTHHGFARCQVLGDQDAFLDAEGRRATIIAPARRGQRRYLPVPMPSCFVLEVKDVDGTWSDHALRLMPCDFMELADGSYLYSGGGSGLWIRAIKISRTGIITHLDGGGAKHQYRLVALPSARYPSLSCDDRTDRLP